MSAMGITPASRERAHQSDLPDVETVTEAFEVAGFHKPDYAFYPVKSRQMRWVFRHLWVVPLLLFGILMILGLGVYVDVTRDQERQVINRWLLSGHIYMENGLFVTRESLFPEKISIVDTVTEFYYKANIPTEEATEDWTLFWEYYRSYQEIRSVRVDLRYYVLPFVVWMTIFSILVSRFIFRAPKLLWELARSGRLGPDRPENNHDLDWKQFASHLDSGLVANQRKVVIISIVISLLATLLVAFGRESLQPLITADWGGERISAWSVAIEYTVIIGAALVLGSVLGLSFWTLWVVADHIAIIPNVFHIDLQPSHRDRCGGLKNIGDLIFRITVIVMSVGLLLVYVYATGTVQGSIPEISFVIYYGLALLIIVSLVTFIRPVLALHNLMVTERDIFRNEAAASETALRDLAKEIANGQNWQDERMSDELRYRMKLHETLYPENLRFPTWPFSIGEKLIVLAGLLPQILILFAEAFVPRIVSMLEAL